MEVIFHTEQDRERYTKDCIIPNYIEGREREALVQSRGNVWSMSIPWRSRRLARERQRYPVYVADPVSEDGSACTNKQASIE